MANTREKRLTAENHPFFTVGLREPAVTNRIIFCFFKVYSDKLALSPPLVDNVD
ncbi:hypothetical protein EGH67_17625 [Klebsiella aerogenes]|nr:hypothetical protein [Klebsiella aerogenes]QGT21613.1 hypothetical protein GIY02_08120 [Klebsiella aerogenes]QGT26437.1 hypothetical protein GIY01_08035 [Klebsiella aerogenes]QGT31305.1 hypothetical protein GIY00_08285 [Klebsiella aerogenes]QHJ54752.1 hypothetical protein GUU79_25910 [Klebsiella aerogenes]